MIEFQSQFLPEICLDLIPPPKQLLAVLGEKHKIIAIPKVISAFKVMFDKLVQAVQVDIGKELAVQVPDGKALVFGRMEQGLMG